jgi:hypothetical protein
MQKKRLQTVQVVDLGVQESVVKEEQHQDLENIAIIIFAKQKILLYVVLEELHLGRERCVTTLYVQRHMCVVTTLQTILSQDH